MIRIRYGSSAQRMVALGAVMPLVVLGLLGAPVAQANSTAPAGIDFIVDSAMGPVRSRVFRAADGNTSRVAYGLDGMDAPDDYSQWETKSDIVAELTAANVNVVLPLGGRASFYSDWLQLNSWNPADCLGAEYDMGSSRSGPAEGAVRPEWETFLTSELPDALRDRLGFRSVRNAIFGVSMGAGAALTIAAYHPAQFSFVAALSGFPNISAPGMPEAVRLAVAVRGEYNLDCMWGPPWAPGWRTHDPFVTAPLLAAAGTRLYIGGGTGIPGAEDLPTSSGGPVEPHDFMLGDALEVLSFINIRSYQLRLETLGYHNVSYHFWVLGIHSWPAWAVHAPDMVPELSDHIG